MPYETLPIEDIVWLVVNYSFIENDGRNLDDMPHHLLEELSDTMADNPYHASSTYHETERIE